MDEKLQKLKTKPNLTRVDIADLLKSIAPPGQKQEEKVKAVKQLEKNNFQGHGLHHTLDSFGEY